MFASDKATTTTWESPRAAPASAGSSHGAWEGGSGTFLLAKSARSSRMACSPAMQSEECQSEQKAKLRSSPSARKPHRAHVVRRRCRRSGNWWGRGSRRRGARGARLLPYREVPQEVVEAVGPHAVLRRRERLRGPQPLDRLRRVAKGPQLVPRLVCDDERHAAAAAGDGRSRRSDASLKDVAEAVLLQVVDAEVTHLIRPEDTRRGFSVRGRRARRQLVEGGNIVLRRERQAPLGYQARTQAYGLPQLSWEPLHVLLAVLGIVGTLLALWARTVCLKLGCARFFKGAGRSRALQ